MSEDTSRLVGALLAAVIVAGNLIFARAAYKVMRDTRDDQRAFSKSMLERADSAMWAAEVDAARDAPGEA